MNLYASENIYTHVLRTYFKWLPQTLNSLPHEMLLFLQTMKIGPDKNK